MATAIPRWKTDWTKCCLCQEDRDEELNSPPTRYAMKQDGYSMIGKNIPMFQSVNEMPIKFDPARLDEGSGVEDTLRANKAKYHQSCRGLFSNTRLARAQKKQPIQVAVQKQKALPSCEEPVLIANGTFALSVNESRNHLSFIVQVHL